MKNLDCDFALSNRGRISIQTIRTGVESPESTKSTPEESDIHPWRRLFARILDYQFFGIFVGFFVGVLSVFLVPFRYILSSTAALSVLVSLFWIPFESLCLNLSGKTPGKWVMGLAVKRREEQRLLTFGEALQRSVNVWVKGFGLGIPLINLVCALFAKNSLHKNGRTSWDQHNRVVGDDMHWVVAFLMFGVIMVLILGV